MRHDAIKRLEALEASRPPIARHSNGRPLLTAADADRMEDSEVIDWAINIYRNGWAFWRGIDRPSTIAISPDTHHIQDSEFASFYRRITERMNDILKADGSALSIIFLPEITQALEWLDSGDMRLVICTPAQMRPDSKPWHRISIRHKEYTSSAQHMCDLYTYQFYMYCDSIEAFAPDLLPAMETNEAGFRQVLEWMREMHIKHEAA